MRNNYCSLRHHRLADPQGGDCSLKSKLTHYRISANLAPRQEACHRARRIGGTNQVMPSSA
jgi:hypothetical protein